MIPALRTDAQLNEKQAEAVAHKDGPALVLAGAGSGKTRVITSRAVKLISDGAAPWSIFCVTFTNKAAQEMQQRIAVALGIDVKDLWISTFHSACLRILKKDYPKAGFPTMPVVFDAVDQKSLIKTIIKEMGYTDAQVPHRKALSLISRFKNDMKTPQDMAANGKMRDAKTMAEIFHQYQTRLMENNAVDFDDLLLKVIRLLEHRSDVRDRYREQFKYVMVDEFQDTNIAQYRLIKLIGGAHKNIFVVGDDDQSIYRWRGAKVGNILGFEKDFPDCKVIKLEENYRSDGNILKAAGAVVKNVYGRKEKTLWTRKEGGEDITLYVASNEQEEADFMADTIRKEANSGGRKYGDYAVFYRTNAQSRVIEERFNLVGIPYRIYGGLKFYARKEVKDIMAYFKLAVNSSDEIGFQRAVSNPPRGIGMTTIKKLVAYSRNKGVPILDACADPENGIAKATQKKLIGFHAMITEIKKLSPEVAAAALIERTLEDSGTVSHLLSKSTALDNARVENLRELADAPYSGELIEEFMDRTSLASEADNVEETPESVSLMTLHVSKGLEFPVVFMTGMEEELFPHINSMETVEELDEERRLCYVGMTRAMRKLYMTRAVRRRLFGMTNVNQPSNFLHDIPKEIVETKVGRYVASHAGEHLTHDEMPEIPEEAFGQTEFSVGRAVRHPTYGRGIIKKCEGTGDTMKVTVLFRDAGTKKILRKFLKPAA